MILKFTISESLEVSIHNGDDSIPFIYQPHYPDGNPFENNQAATRWAEEFIANFEKSIEE